MELTHQEAENLLQERLTTRRDFQTLLNDPKFETTVADILEFLGVDRSHAHTVKHELSVVMSFYAPYDELAPNIAESIGIKEETAARVVLYIDAVLLGDIGNELRSFQELWRRELKKTEGLPEVHMETKEKLELRPEGVERTLPQLNENSINNDAVPQPLTREEVMEALASKRTMASDIESVKGANNPPSPPKET